jgi:hypothetical protein
VNKPENVVEDLRVVRILLEPDEFDVDHVEALIRLGQEFAQQIVHRKNLSLPVCATGAFGSIGSVLGKSLSFVAAKAEW